MFSLKYRTLRPSSVASASAHVTLRSRAAAGDARDSPDPRQRFGCGTRSLQLCQLCPKVCRSGSRGASGRWRSVTRHLFFRYLHYQEQFRCSAILDDFLDRLRSCLASLTGVHRFAYTASAAVHGVPEAVSFVPEVPDAQVSRRRRCPADRGVCRRASQTIRSHHSSIGRQSNGHRTRAARCRRAE